MRSLAVAAVLVLASGTARAGDAGTTAETTDFSPQVRTLFRVAACGNDDAVPERFNAKAIERHCK